MLSLLAAFVWIGEWLLGRDAWSIFCYIEKHLACSLWKHFESCDLKLPISDPYLTHSGPGSPRMKGVCLHTKQGQLPDQWPCCNKDPSSYASSETGVFTHVSQPARWLGSLWITSLQAQVWWPSRLFCSKDFSQFHSFLRFNLGKS